MTAVSPYLKLPLRTEAEMTAKRASKRCHELVPFLAVWATQYQRDYRLDGLHPTHYDLMVKYGCRMDSFKRATDAAGVSP